MHNLKFFGAAQTVTGSCYLLQTKDKNFLIDCGMFQGTQVKHLNEKFEFDPSTIDAVFLTHAHIDHSGMIPKLYREGFVGKVYSTHESHELTEILLYDSAKIQENNLKYGRVDSGSLYDTVDVDSYVKSMETVVLNEWVDIMGLRVKYIRAGHILGAASILIESEGTRILFSGDIGCKEQSLVLPYEYLNDEVDYVVMESLYGGQEHDSRQHSIDDVIKIINETEKRDGNVMVPSFSVHRTQEIVAYLVEAFKGNRISQDVQIILDGPLGLSATEIYTRALSSYSDKMVRDYRYVYSGKEINSIFTDNHIFKVFDNFVSKRLVKKTRKVIIAGNGMAHGGRIMNYLYKGLPKEKNSVIFVGYQAEDTIGRMIQDGDKYVRINNKNVKVDAQIYSMKGFSSHAGNSDLLDWFEDKRSERLKKVFLVHADIDRSQAFKIQIENQGYDVEIPSLNSSYKLG